MIRSHLGRVIVAGADGSGTAFGVARFLEDHDVRFSAPGRAEFVPDLKDAWLHEFVLFDWPHFKTRPVPGGWKLMSQRPPRADVTLDKLDETAVARAKEVAETIKNCARRGTAIPQALAAAAGPAPLSNYVAAKLLWDPFADTTRLIREFRAGM